MTDKRTHKVLRIIKWSILSIVMLVLIVPILVYVPFTQDLIIDAVLSEVNKSSSMKISANHIRLSFPLNLSIKGATVIDNNGDTMVVAGALDAKAAILPLFKGDITIDNAKAAHVKYIMGNQDSAMSIVSHIIGLNISDANVNLGNNDISINSIFLDGGNVAMALRKDSTESKTESDKSGLWRIKAGEIKLANVSYRMAMENVADSISTHISDLILTNGIVDMKQQPLLITAETLSTSITNATYIIDSSSPAKDGLDTNHLSINDIYIKIDSFYNKGTKMIVPIKQLSGAERCGVTLDTHGTFEMDSIAMFAHDFNISTLFSSINIDGEIGTGDRNTTMNISTDSRIGVADIELLYPSLRPLLSEIPRYNDILINADIKGSMSHLNINTLSVELPRYLQLAATGEVNDITNSDNLSGDIDLSGNLANVNFIKPSVLEARLRDKVNVPPITLHGNIHAERGTIGGILQAITGDGELALDAAWNSKGELYNLKLAVDSFPVNSFLPEMGMGSLSADISINGKEYDLMSPSAQLDANITLNHLTYKSRSYNNARAWVTLKNSNAEAGIVSLNDNADFDIVANAIIDKTTDINWTLTGDIRNLDMRSLGLTPDKAHGTLTLSGEGFASFYTNTYNANVSLTNVDWAMSDMRLKTPKANVFVATNDSLVKANIINHDLSANFVAFCPIDSLISKLSSATAELDSQIVTQHIDIKRLQQKLPQFAANITSGNSNIINSILASKDMSIDAMTLTITNDSLFNMNSGITGFRSGKIRLDDIKFSALQHSKYLIYRTSIDNERGTLDKFAHVSINGYLADDKVAAFIKQSNIDDVVGFNLGLTTTIADSSFTIKFAPYSPVIGYKNWNINTDNFVNFNFYTHHLDANIIMNSDESSFKLYTEHTDNNHQEDVVLNISDIKLSELLSVSPFAPPIKGLLSADMRFRWDSNTLNGDGQVSLNEMYYGRSRVGSFDLGASLQTNKSGAIQAEASLMVDDVKTITAVGALNDTTASNPFNLDFTMIRFPLRVINPFLPRNTASLSGVLNGKMEITGDLSAPLFNGHIDFDSTAIKINMIGSSFKFSDEKVPVKNNIITFSDYKITGANENPLTINGTVDMKDFISPDINLAMKARDMQIINSSRGKGTDIYGKGFINLDTSVKGNLSQLDIDASLTLLSGSNLTYIMTDATSAISSQSTGEMVKFVQFADTIATEDADSVETSSLALNLDAVINIMRGTTINVDLSTDGKNKVQLQGSGTLNYTMSEMGDSRFTGRYTIEKGFARYTPPLMSEKLFNFNEGSYVAFNGDMLNPILNIHATDEIRANVSREGQNSRLVNFDVSLAVTNTLSNMDVAFDLSSSDDITVQNELQSMSAEQRANQAMNLLLYNVYTGPGTTANANMSGNPLFSFLESQINTWAANNIKFVDISFGIDQYDKTMDGETSKTTSYSYRVSKTLFNDRFKIVVGGNYSTDTETDEEVTQNLINDISFEYMLNRSGSMYVKIFRHVGYESILEGEVTQTGVGFVYKRKLQSLRDLFRFRRRNKAAKTAPANNTPTTVIVNEK